MTRPWPLLLALLALLAPAELRACSMIRGEPPLPRPDATQGTAPRPPMVAAVRVGRGDCGDLAHINLWLRDVRGGEYGYRLAVAAGQPPPGLVLESGLIGALEGIVHVGWIDTPADLTRPFRFVLALIAVDGTGRESPVSMVAVAVDPWRPRPMRRRRRPIPPLVWVVGGFGVFALAPLFGWLRRPRVG